MDSTTMSENFSAEMTSNLTDTDTLTKEEIAILAQSQFFFKASQAVNNYYAPVIIVIGLIGNTLSFLVMLQPHNKALSCCLYLAALAVTDNLFMLNCLEVVLMMGPFAGHFSDNHCKFAAYYFQVCGVNSSFIITGVTLERYLAICFPLKSAQWRTTKRAKMILCGIFTFSALYNIPYIFTAGMSVKLLCAAVVCSSFWCKVWSWSGFALNFAFPFLSLMIMNFLIVRAIRNRGKYFKKNKEPNKPKTDNETVQVSTVDHDEVRKRENTLKHAYGSEYESRKRKPKSIKKAGETSKEGQLTAMLLLVTTCFLIFTSPQYIRYIIFANFNIYKNVETFVKVSLLYQSTQKSFFTNSAINFFLYCIAGSKFRRDCIALFCKKGRGYGSTTASRSKDSSSTLDNGSEDV